MIIDRRKLLAGAGLAATAAATRVRAQAAPPASATLPAPDAPPKPSLDERYAAAARANRMRLAYDGRNFSGAGFDFLVREARAAQFTLLGEDHFMAEIPRLAGQLFAALRPAGYERISVEISPPAAEMVDAALRRGGLEGLKAWLAANPIGVAFYNLKAEAEFLADARRLIAADQPMLWGTDYEFGADRALIRRLKLKAPPSARASVQGLQDASDAAWAKFDSSKDPMTMFPFGGDPERVRAVRAAWPHADEEALSILSTLEQTLIINGHYRAERYYLSNQTRADNQRANFLRLWRAELARGRRPKVLMKYGWTHMVRGLSATYNLDLGTLVSELAVTQGGHAFGVLVIGGPGAKQGVFNPVDWTTTPTPVDSFDEQGFTPVAGQLFADGFTVFDLRPLRVLPAAKADPRLVRIVHGFDALVVLPGATPSVFL